MAGGISFKQTKGRLLSTFILALALVAQPFSVLQVATAYAATAVSVCASGCDYTDLQEAIDSVDAGGVVTLTGNVTLGSEVTITKPVTVIGADNDSGITAAFVKTDSDNNAALGIIGTSGVTIENLYVNGDSFDGNNLHGVNVYESIGVQLNNLNIHSMDRYGVVVNSSKVTIDSISTSGNGWGGINVDTGTTLPAQLTVTGVSYHDELNQLRTERGGVLVDNTTNHQYVEYPAGSGFYTTDTDAIGNVLNTTTHKAFDTIQGALDHSSTIAGNVIAVGAGSYAENITVNKSVTIVGPNVGVNPVTNDRDDEAVLTGQISVYASGVTIEGLTITNPSYSGATIRGVHIYGSGAGISNVSVKNNIFTDIANASAKGAYGVMVQGAVSGVEVTDNLLTGITSAGWAHAIEVTPAGGVTATPSNVTVTGNSISGVTNASGTDQYDFSVDSSGSVFANANGITFSGNRLTGTVRNLDPAHTLNASANWWGQYQGPVSSQYSGNVTVAPWCTSDDCSYLQTETNQPLALPVVAGVAQVVGDVVLNSPSANSDVSAYIPNGTTVTASNPAWNGTIAAPTVTSFTVPNAQSTGLAIAVGSNDYSLSFSKAVQLYLPGQGGKSVGFKAPGGNFTEITATCNENISIDNQLVAPVNECKMTYGNDMIIWTKHFTTFAAFSFAPQNNTQASTAGQSRGAAGYPRSGTYESPYFYDDSWMEGANTDDTAKTTGTVAGDSVGLSSTSTVADAVSKEIPATGTAWYWWLLIAALAAGAWPVFVTLRRRYFNS